jgi:hypothetical protein
MALAHFAPKAHLDLLSSSLPVSPGGHSMNPCRPKYSTPAFLLAHT